MWQPLDSNEQRLELLNGNDLEQHEDNSQPVLENIVHKSWGIEATEPLVKSLPEALDVALNETQSGI